MRQEQLAHERRAMLRAARRAPMVPRELGLRWSRCVFGLTTHPHENCPEREKRRQPRQAAAKCACRSCMCAAAGECFTGSCRCCAGRWPQACAVKMGARLGRLAPGNDHTIDEAPRPDVLPPALVVTRRAPRKP